VSRLPASPDPKTFRASSSQPTLWSFIMFDPISLSGFGQILAHTPTWVFGLFAALLVLGLKQLSPSRPGLRRVVVMPLAMTGLSIYGTVSAFGATPAVLLAWLLAAAVTALAVLRRSGAPAVTYDAASQRFAVPGSAVPLALMMGIFFLKYAVGVALAMHPALRQDPMLTVLVGALYGGFSGVFAARAWRLVRVALRQHGLPATATA
jgi:hypothetical protein